MVVIWQAFLDFLDDKTMQEVLITNLASVMYKRYAEKNMQDLKRHMVSLINNDCLMHCSLIVLLINRTKQYNTQRKKNQSQKLNFLDANIINNGIEKNDFKIYLKYAITNVQIKPHLFIN